MNSLVFNERSNASPKAKIAIEKLHEVGCHIAAGNLPWYFYVTWTATSLAAVNKRELEELEAGELMDCRPVAKGNTFRKVFTATLLEPFKQAIIDVTAPTQFGSGEKAGGSQLVFAAQLMLEANPSFVAISLDIKNAFNEVTRKVVLEKLWEDLRLRNLWYYFWRVKSINSYIGLGSGTKMQKAPFYVKKASNKAQWRAWLYSL